MSNFNINSFDNPTVGGIPLSPNLNLAAGATDMVPLGMIDPSKYEYITANAVVSSSSSDLFVEGAAAAAVPEPSSFVLLVAGTTLGMFGYAWYRRWSSV